jgi:hypothetical protein
MIQNLLIRGPHSVAGSPTLSGIWKDIQVVNCCSITLLPWSGNPPNLAKPRNTFAVHTNNGVVNVSAAILASSFHPNPNCSYQLSVINKLTIQFHHVGRW